MTGLGGTGFTAVFQPISALKALFVDTDARWPILAGISALTTAALAVAAIFLSQTWYIVIAAFTAFLAAAFAFLGTKKRALP